MCWLNCSRFYKPKNKHMTMKRIAIIFSCLAMLSSHLASQNHLVGDAKKKINVLTTNVSTYREAMKILKPALSNDETRNKPETWALASEIRYGLYDKCIDSKRVGKSVDLKEMGEALVDACDYGMTALKLDTIRQRDNKGRLKINKKTGRPTFKTKYSGDVINRLSEHLNDYRTTGSELYNVKQFDLAYQCWGDYYRLAQRIHADDSKWMNNDTTIAEVLYYQALAAWQKGDNNDAVRLFASAREHGYTRKEAYDYALICLSDMNDVEGIVRLANDAYAHFGTQDPQYIRIVINNYIDNNQLDKAQELINDALDVNSDDDELLNLKGLVVEQTHGIDEALTYYEKCIRINPTNAQGQFNVGRYYYNAALQKASENYKMKRKQLRELVEPIYRQALPFLENAHALDPGNVDVVNALRDIYYKLNMGDRLESLDRQ